LAFERSGAGKKFGGSFPAYNERERPKRLRRKLRMFEEICGTGEGDTWLALGFLSDGRSLGGGEHRDPRERRDLLAIPLKGRANSGGEHRRARRTLDAGREWTEIVAGKNLDGLLDGLRTPRPVEEIPGLQAALRPYQREGVGWLYFLSGLGLGACLADDMGLGKTLQVIALLCLLRDGAGGAAPPCLVVVPASLVGNWLRELGRFAPHLRARAAHPAFASPESLNELKGDPESALKVCDVLVTTYGFLQRTGALQQTEWDLAVLDEAQAIKNPSTQQAQSVKRLRARARVALTHCTGGGVAGLDHGSCAINVLVAG
jgi:SNF2 family DNA or RNA helicase